VNEPADKVSEPPVFGLQTWRTAIATAWVLTRNCQFTDACNHDNVETALQTEWLADEWKRAGARPGDQSGRKPVKLFPSVTAARQKLNNTLGSGLDFDRDAVLKGFPDLDTADRKRLLASVWRGDDPRKYSRIPLSHGAWWIASDHGTRPVALDDVATWRPAFEFILEPIVKGNLTILATDPPPPRPISPGEFDGVPIEYPCAALVRSPYRPGRDSYIACTIDPEQRQIGDRYFEKANRIAKWSHLVVQSEELLKICKRILKPCSLDDYKNHVDEAIKKTGRRPSDAEDDAWAKNNNYSTTDVRARRKDFTDALPPAQQEAAKKPGRPRR
jgi:hypothetical protein